MCVFALLSLGKQKRRHEKQLLCNSILKDPSEISVSFIIQLAFVRVKVKRKKEETLKKCQNSKDERCVISEALRWHLTFYRNSILFVFSKPAWTRGYFTHKCVVCKHISLMLHCVFHWVSPLLCALWILPRRTSRTKKKNHVVYKEKLMNEWKLSWFIKQKIKTCLNHWNKMSEQSALNDLESQSVERNYLDSFGN